MRVPLTLSLLATATLTYAAYRGYYDAPYLRYEADEGTYAGATVVHEYSQEEISSEASFQTCLMMPAGASVSWTLRAAGNGLNIRFALPENTSGSVAVYRGDNRLASLDLTTYWSWEHLATNGNSNNTGMLNNTPSMRFDEVHTLLPASIQQGETLKIVAESGTVYLDFAELEQAGQPLTAPEGAAVYNGNASSRAELQAFIDSHGGQTIYLPQGTYTLDGTLELNVDGTRLQGAGIWYTTLYFNGATGGVWGYKAAHLSDVCLNTARNSRSASYKAINGPWGYGSTIERVWEEHFECGAWIANYNEGWGNAAADHLTVRHCRFRNNYADGINLCKGSSGCLVEHCSFRNNGDDDMAVWSADNQECSGNTFQFNTAELSWRAAGCALYGGKNNTWRNLLIRDNREAGIRVSNSFAGAPFNEEGTHLFQEITIERCGTFADYWNNVTGAIDLGATTVCGDRVRNVTFRCVDVNDSKCNAVWIQNKGGYGFENIQFLHLSVNGTGVEGAVNDPSNRKPSWLYGYGIVFADNPSGYITWCDLSFSQLGGGVTGAVNLYGQGGCSWTERCDGTTGCEPPAYTDGSLTSAETAACAPEIVICPNPATDGFRIRTDAALPVTVYSADGKAVASGTTRYTSTARLPKGAYLVRVNGRTLKLCKR